MARRKILKILFFTNGHATEEDYAEGDKIIGNVCYRRADLIKPEDPLEDFDKVTGEVPKNYAAEAARRADDEAENPPLEAPKADGSAVPAKSPVAPAKPETVTTWKPNA